LVVQRNSCVTLGRCTTTTLDGEQRWRYDERTGRLMNPWSEFCATHVTDPAEVGAALPRWRQILMAQNCSADMVTGRPHDSYRSQFMSWRFINP